MKKILTLVFCLGAFAISFAQYDPRQNNDDRNYHPGNKRDDQYANSSNDHRRYDRDDKDGRRFDRGNNYSAKARNFQIDKINRDFAFRVQAIQHDRHLRRREKKVAIRNAEIERARQIEMVNDRYSYNNRRNH